MRFIFLLLFPLSVFAQSETHDFVTYDTTVTIKTGTYDQYVTVFTLRISRPKEFFNPGHPDSQPRPWIWTMPGQGEVGTNPAFLSKYGPHYLIANGKWDGGIKLGNGTHYPILITMITSVVNVKSDVVSKLMDVLWQRYKPLKNGVHVAGLSMGGFTFGSLITYARTQGDKTNMSRIRSYVSLQGLSSLNPVNNFSWGDAGFGIWAKDYGGQFFGLEGVADGRKIWIARDAIVKAGMPGNAYFSMENIGDGGHCCWNDMYDPKRTNWKNHENDLGTNIAWNRYYPNSMGSYINGSNILQWMLRQGDTTLIGTAPSIPIRAFAGVDREYLTPIDSVVLAGEAWGGVTSVDWERIDTTAGPDTIFNANTLHPTIKGLWPGPHTYRLIVQNAKGETAIDEVTIMIIANPKEVIFELLRDGTWRPVGKVFIIENN